MEPTTDITVNCASITLTKTADATSVNAKDTIGYPITATTSGAAVSHGFTISDTLPTNTGLTFTFNPATTTYINTPSLHDALPIYLGTTTATKTFSVHISSPTAATTCRSEERRVGKACSHEGSGDTSTTLVTTTDITVTGASNTLTKTTDPTPVNAQATTGDTVTAT